MSLFREDASTAALPGIAVDRVNPLGAPSSDDEVPVNDSPPASPFPPESPFEPGSPFDLDSSTSTVSWTTRTTEVDVLVIGGGVSGLTAAVELVTINPSLRVAVLEAKTRVGGRTLTSTMLGAEGTMPCDLGGQWLGSSQPHILKLLERLDLKTYPQWASGTHIVQLNDGVPRTFTGAIPYTVGIATTLSLGWLQVLLNRLQLRLTLGSAPMSHDEAEEFDTRSLAEFICANTFFFCRRTVLQLMAMMTRVVFGCEPHELSVPFFVSYCRAAGSFENLLESAPGGGQEFRIAGGAQQISQRLADVLGRENVHTGCPVTRLTDYALRGVEAEVADGRRWRARRVILALPPHLVVRIDHSPPLPTWREQLGQRMPMGHLIKVLVTYQFGFWRQRGLSGQAISSRGPLCTVFDASSADALSPALVCFLGGEQATAWAARPKAERCAAVLQHLYDLFGVEDALNPLDYIEHDWAAEPYNGGCPVARMTPGTQSTLAYRLAQPVGSLHFAGTELATCWTGFINGAVESGQRAAAEVASALGKRDVAESDEVRVALVDTNPPVRPLYRDEPPPYLELASPVAGVLGSFAMLVASVRILTSAFKAQAC